MARSTEILEDRWHSAVTKPKLAQEPDGSRSTTLDNSDDYYRWETAVVRIATRLRGDHLSPSELEQVEQIAAGIWDQTLRAQMLEWAQEHAA